MLVRKTSPGSGAYHLKLGDYLFACAHRLNGRMVLHYLAYGTGAAFGEEDLRSACAALASRHPLLRARPAGDRDPALLRVDPAADPAALAIDFQSLTGDGSDGTDWLAASVSSAWQTCNTPGYSFPAGYLWRVTARVAPGPDGLSRYAVILSISHAIADGRRAWHALKGLLEHLDDPSATRPVHQLPSAGRDGGTALGRTSTILRWALHMLRNDLRVTRMGGIESRPGSDVNRFRYLRMDPEIVRRIRVRAREHEARYSEVVAAACALAAARSRRFEASTSTTVWLSITTLADAAPGERLLETIVNLAGVTAGSVPVVPEDTLGSTVRKVSRLQLARHLDHFQYDRYSERLAARLARAGVARHGKPKFFAQIVNQRDLERPRVGKRITYLGQWYNLNMYIPFRLNAYTVGGIPHFVFMSSLGQTVVDRFKAEFLELLDAENLVEIDAETIGDAMLPDL